MQNILSAYILHMDGVRIHIVKQQIQRQPSTTRLKPGASGYDGTTSFINSSCFFFLI